MSGGAYEDMGDEKLILRDHLAIDRTKLAAERTMLAYMRTALTLIIAGVTFNKFFVEYYYQIIAWIFILSGLALVLYSFFRFMKRVDSKP